MTEERDDLDARWVDQVLVKPQKERWRGSRATFVLLDFIDTRQDCCYNLKEKLRIPLL